MVVDDEFLDGSVDEAVHVHDGRLRRGDVLKEALKVQLKAALDKQMSTAQRRMYLTHLVFTEQPTHYMDPPPAC